MPWQCPTLPASFPASTIGAGGLNFRVRNENGCTPTAKITKTLANLPYVEPFVKAILKILTKE